MTLCNLQIQWLYISFTSLSLLNSLFFITRGNPPNKCAKLTRQINPPKWPAKMSCHENLPDPPARMTRRIHLPEIPPSLLKIPRQNMARQPFPPPHSSANRAGGGQGVDPARLCTLNRYFSFSFSHLMNGYIFLYNTIHTYSTQSGLNKV
jgi:hypothetical protein